MKHAHYMLLICVLLLGCDDGKKNDGDNKKKTTSNGDAPKYTVLATYVDNFDEVLKTSQPEQALSKYSGANKIDCMVGLFEYNPPKIFSVLKGAGKLGDIKVVGFDENVETLQQIRDGNCVGTVVQNPYMYGYQSVKVLHRLLNGDESDVNEKKYVDVPARVINKENVDEFEKELKENLKAAESIQPVTDSEKKIAYVTNGIAEFWNIAKAGAMKAGDELKCEVKVVMPIAEGGRAANQQAELEKLIANKFDGIAVSPVDPDNQTAILNQVGDAAEFITHDSDAPKSNRKLYIGMSNYDAGFMVADLVKKALPEGGNVVLFIGSVDQENGRLRRQGVIDGLMGREKDPTRFDKIDQVIKK